MPDSSPRRRSGSSVVAAAAAALVAGLTLVLAAPSSVAAAPLRAVPVDVRALDGRALPLFATGDEFHHRVHDAEGFTVLRDPITGRVVYASVREGRLVPTGLEFGRGNPRTLGLVPGLDDGEAAIRRQVASRRAALPMRLNSAPTRGVINNLVLFVRFKGEAPLTTPVTTWEAMLDSPDPAVPSLRGYYDEVSYGTLTVRSHLLPTPVGDTVASWQDTFPRSYYQEHNATTNPGGYPDAGEQMVREQQMIRRALEATVADIPPGTNLDGDGDGFVDNLTVVVAGKPDGWNSLLWPHMSLQVADLIYLTNPSDDSDLIVLTFNLQLNDYILNNAGIGVLAHEMFHTLGGPDLYHYSHDSLNPAGPWDLMEWDAKIPQHMSLHQKVRYAHWAATPPLITESGTYVVNPLTSPDGQGWRLPVPGQPQQFFQIEYRRKAGVYESSLPSSGLLIWRVDERWWGNNDGPPDELYVFRPGGTLTADGQVQQAPFAAGSGRTSFDLGSDPAPFDQVGTGVGVRITDISAAGGDTMSFTVCMAYATCFLKQCGDDGCGGTCGTCASDRLCEDRLCVAEQKCATLSTCLAACTDAACRADCRRVPAACPKPATCRQAGTCDEGTGQCAYPLAVEGTPCDDKDTCSLDDACRTDGTCGGAPNPACLPDDPAPDVASGDLAAELPSSDIQDVDAAPDASNPTDLPTEPRDGVQPDAVADLLLPDTASDLAPVAPNAASGGCTAGTTASPAALLPGLLALLGLAIRRRRR